MLWAKLHTKCLITSWKSLAHCCAIFLGHWVLKYDRHRNPNINIREIIWLGNQLEQHVQVSIHNRTISWKLGESGEVCELWGEPKQMKLPIFQHKRLFGGAFPQVAFSCLSCICCVVLWAAFCCIDTIITSKSWVKSMWWRPAVVQLLTLRWPVGRREMIRSPTFPIKS